MSDERKKHIYLASPHMSEEGYELEYIHEAFRTNWVAPLGPNVNAFEEEFSNYLETEKAAALSSGTSAIHLALKLLGVGRNYKPHVANSSEEDVVLVSSLTFSATVNPIIYERATAVLIDSEEESWNMDPKALELALQRYGKRVKAVIAVHLYGLSAKIDQIQALCDQYQVPLLEDAAESLGTMVQSRYYSDGEGSFRTWHEEPIWKHTGTMGDLACFSFNGNKIITTSGGGMLVANRRENAEQYIDKVRFWSTQSRDPAPWYQHSELGFNYRMSNICAGIGRGQLKIIDEHIDKKRAIYERYRNAFSQNELIKMMPVPDWVRPNYWLSCCAFQDEKLPQKVYEILQENAIDSRPIWKPMHLQPYYENCDFVTARAEGSFAEELFKHGLCLPSDVNMSEDEQDRVISLILSVL